MVHFSYIGGCDVCEGTCIEVLKELAWAIDKWLQVIIIINKMLFKTVVPLRI